MRRFPLAFLLVGLLALMAAAGGVLGAVQAPTGTDLAVHNGAGETLQASRVIGTYSASYLGSDVVFFDFTAPDQATEVAKSRTGVEKAHRVVKGATATGILEPIRALLAIDDFSQHGTRYDSEEPVADLVPVAQRSQVSGTYRTEVTIAGGYVVGVQLEIRAVERGQRLSESVVYRLAAVGSWEAG